MVKLGVSPRGHAGTIACGMPHRGKIGEPSFAGRFRPSINMTGSEFVRKLKDELKTGTLHAMCGQLGIKVSDL